MIDTDARQVHYDNYGGQWGSQSQLDRLLQAYAVEKARLEARRAGHTVTEQPLNVPPVTRTQKTGSQTRRSRSGKAEFAVEIAPLRPSMTAPARLRISGVPACELINCFACRRVFRKDLDTYLAFRRKRGLNRLGKRFPPVPDDEWSDPGGSCSDADGEAIRCGQELVFV